MQNRLQHVATLSPQQNTPTIQYASLNVLTSPSCQGGGTACGGRFGEMSEGQRDLALRLLHSEAFFTDVQNS